MEVLTGKKFIMSNLLSTVFIVSLFVFFFIQSANVWLGGLFSPEAYVTASRQHVAQENKWSLEELQLKVRTLCLCTYVPYRLVCFYIIVNDKDIECLHLLNRNDLYFVCLFSQAL